VGKHDIARVGGHGEHEEGLSAREEREKDLEQEIARTSMPG